MYIIVADNIKNLDEYVPDINRENLEILAKAGTNSNGKSVKVKNYFLQLYLYYYCIAL